MSLPAARRIATGRTHAAPWDPVRYSCALEVHRPLPPIKPIFVGIATVAAIAVLVPLALHIVLRWKGML
jgi:hypothetical protein